MTRTSSQTDARHLGLVHVIPDLIRDLIHMNMRNFFILTAIAAILSAATSCKEQNTPPAEGSRIGYALSFFKTVNSVTPKGENVIVSPYSAGVVLSMLEAGAEGNTKVELDNALNGTLFKAEDLDAEGLTVESANSIWISNSYSVRDRYVAAMENDFDAFVGNYDFSNPSILKMINDWCSEHTNGKITEIIDYLDPVLDKMILVNALYFNAPWVDAFNPDLTHDDVFHAVDGDRTVRMMYRKAVYEYAEYQGFQIAGIPYEGGRYSMYIILPPEDMDLDSNIAYINESVYDTAMNMLSPEEVSLTMPKFKLETSMVLDDALRKMGVNDAFSVAAEFGGISDSGKVLTLGFVKQKCYIDVSEKGTEAAAVTGAQIRMTSVRPETIMNVDRPFVFMIADREAENILFAGKIVTIG